MRHDKPLHPTRIQPHLKNVPKYLLPRMAPVPGSSQDADSTPAGAKPKGFVPFKKASNRGKAPGRGGKTGGKRKSDPLRKFK